MAPERGGKYLHLNARSIPPFRRFFSRYPLLRSVLRSVWPSSGSRVCFVGSLDRGSLDRDRRAGLDRAAAQHRGPRIAAAPCATTDRSTSSSRASSQPATTSRPRPVARRTRPGSPPVTSVSRPLFQELAEVVVQA